jgi:peroxiredoxin
LERRSSAFVLVVFAAVLALTAADVSFSATARRVLSSADAFKELDLIKPSREKLAHDFTLPMQNAQTFHLADQRGKIVFVNFWATWCGPCREEMPAMERLWREHREHGFVVVAVSVDSNPNAVAPFVKKGGFTFPVVLDPKLQVSNAYGVRVVPSSFLIDKKGNLAALALGPRMWDGDAAHSLIDAMVR